MAEGFIEPISYTTLGDFYGDFCAGKFPGKQFGEAFMDVMYPELSMPDIHDELDQELATSLIVQRFVDITLSFGKGKLYEGRSILMDIPEILEENEKEKK